MTPASARPPTRRLTPALAVNVSLAAALLALAVAGDAPRPAPEAAPTAPAAQARRTTPEPVAGSDREARVPRGEATREAKDDQGNALIPQQAPDAVLAEAIRPLLTEPEVRLSVSVLSLESGLAAGYGDDSFDTASIVKVDLVAAMLLRAQDEGRDLTGTERAYAEAMIRSSDNDAAHAVWAEIGQGAGLDAANARLGLTETTASDGLTWGLTQTTSADQIALLRAVFGSDSALRPESRAYLRGLMGEVLPEQQWGVSAASEGEFELKNGWLPRSQTDLWDVNSIGRVTVDGGSYLVAVLSDGHATQADGVALVEAAARHAVAAVTSRPPG